MGVDGLRVLHVAADASAREWHANILERRGFETVTASDAETASRLLAESPVDCVLSGYHLPERDGLDFLADIRDDYPQMPFVLLTSETSTAVVERAVAAGVTDYVPTLLLDISEELLAHRVKQAVAADDVELDEAPPLARRADNGQGESPDASTDELFDLVRAALDAPATDESRTDDDFVWVPLGNVAGVSGIDDGSAGNGHPRSDHQRGDHQRSDRQSEAGGASTGAPADAQSHGTSGTAREGPGSRSPDTDGGTELQASGPAGTADEQIVFPHRDAPSVDTPADDALRTGSHDTGRGAGRSVGDSGRDVAEDSDAELFDIVDSLGSHPAEVTDDAAGDADGDASPDAAVGTDNRKAGTTDERSGPEVADSGHPGRAGDSTDTLGDLSEEELFDQIEALQERLDEFGEGTDADDAGATDTEDILEHDADADRSAPDRDDEDESHEEGATTEGLLDLDPGEDATESTVEPLIEETPVETTAPESIPGEGVPDEDIPGVDGPSDQPTADAAGVETGPTEAGQTDPSQSPDLSPAQEYSRPGALELRPGTSVLVQCGSQDDRKGAACADLLRPDRVADRNVLLIRYRRMSEGRLENIAASAARTKVISIGYTQPVPQSVRESVDNVKINNPNDVTRLGIVVTGTMDDWQTEAGETVVCYDPLDVLLRYKSVHSAFRFLHIFLSKLQTGDAIAHFHVDPSAGDPQEINTLKPLFDAVLTIDSVGSHLETE